MPATAAPQSMKRIAPRRSDAADFIRPTLLRVRAPSPEHGARFVSRQLRASGGR
jgi:hypothetical protein